MKLPVVSFVALALFALVELTHFTDANMISRETDLINFRDTFHVEQGTSTDGMIVIHETAIDTNNVGQHLKVANHNRTLRAFLANASGASDEAIILETVRPHRFFMITGPKHVMNNFGALRWVGPTKLGIQSGELNGDVIEYVVDVRTLGYITRAYLPTPTSLTQDQIID